MAAGPRKYNPGFLSIDERVATFCVRTAEYDSLIEALRECTGSANTHQIVIGPRGCGKTSLLLRVDAEVLRDADLSMRFFPIVFAEESYEVSTAGEFWLECLSRLADQAPRRDGDVNLHRTFEEMRTIQDDRALEGRCLGVLQDFADRENKRLVLIVENLNMMFRDMGDDDAGWRMRKVLQTEPRIVLLASATSRFEQMDDPKEALYELFRVIPLHPLDTEDCATLWQTISGQARAPQTIQALRILTGGNPRLLTIVARFGAYLSFRELMADLLDLVDDHTEYFKSHLDALPAQERKVYLALAALWKPANAREIAERARLGTSKCSAQLARLIDRGAVEVSGGSARRKLYYLTERLYNIYYLMRRAHGPEPLIDALIRFMEAYYSTDQLRDFGARVAREAPGFDGNALAIYRIAFERLVRLPSLEAHREELLSLAPPDLAHAPGESSPESPIAPSAARELFENALALAENDRLEEAVAAWDEVVRTFWESDAATDLEHVSMALVNKGKALSRLGRAEEALAAWNETARRFDKSRVPALEVAVVNALHGKAIALNTLNRHREAMETCDEVLERVGNSSSPALQGELAAAMVERGHALILLNHADEAMDAWGAVVERFGRSDSPRIVEPVAATFANIGTGLLQSGRLKEALAAFERAMQSCKASDTPILRQVTAHCFANRGHVLAALERETEALSSWEEVIRGFEAGGFPDGAEPYCDALTNSAAVLHNAGRYEEALQLWGKVAERFEDNNEPVILAMVANAERNRGILLERLDRYEEALAVWQQVEDRFGNSDMPEWVTLAAISFQHKCTILFELNRKEEALETCDRAIDLLGKSIVPGVVDTVAQILLGKGIVLDTAQRNQEALAVWDEVIQRFEASDVLALRDAAEAALCSRAQHELTEGRTRAALGFLDRALQQGRAGTPDSRVRGHLIRARGHLAEGDGESGARDVETALSILPELEVLPRDLVVDLADLSRCVGPERMCDLIKSSPVGDLLLPLRTALERELGLEPRVAREVEEIAEDIRRELLTPP